MSSSCCFFLELSSSFQESRSRFVPLRIDHPTHCAVHDNSSQILLMSVKDTLATVQGIREILSKEIEKGDDALDEESCRDLLQQLNDCNMTLQVLSTSLIGTVVSKLKKHGTLGPDAKALVKKWKKVAKEAETQPKSSSNSSQQRKQQQSLQAQRRSSNASSTGSAGGGLPSPNGIRADVEEWSDLPPQRQTMCQKLRQVLGSHKKTLVKSGINADAVDHLLISRASEIEDAISQQLKDDRRGYAEKARSLCFNLKKNESLAEQVILGQVAADELVNMSSEQLASAEINKERQENAKKLIDSKRLDWEQANEEKINEMCGIKGDLLQASLFTCGRCKSTKTTSTQKQTRSADEPMTVFVLCLNCGKRWKC